MLDGVNDRPSTPTSSPPCSTRRAFKVNLIPYNPTGAGYDGSSPERIEALPRDPRRARSPATVRLTRGRDIDAACGQLAAKA